MIHDLPGAVPFVKGHGTGNDFVVLPDVDGRLDLTADLVAALCDRRTGIGADGVLRVVRAFLDPDGAPHADEARYFMDYRNADGSVAEMCGNGIRVFARYLVDALLLPAGEHRIATRAGVRRVVVPPRGDVSVAMGPATFPGPDDVRVEVADPAAGQQGAWPATAVDLGNPHAVVVVDGLAAPGRLLDPPRVTPAAAFPGGVNVEFVVERGAGEIAMRVFERGVGETLSCGTGACAAYAVARRRARAAGTDRPGPWTVDVPGGRLGLDDDSDGGVVLTGPAELVAAGELRPDWLAARRAVTPGASR